MKTDINGKNRAAARYRYGIAAVLVTVAALTFAAALGTEAGENFPEAGILAVLCMVGLILCTSKDSGYRWEDKKQKTGRLKTGKVTGL